MLKKTYSRENLLLKYFLILLLVLCVPIISSLCVFKLSTNTARKYIKINSHHSLMQIQKSLDKDFDYLKHVAFSIAENPDFQNLIYNPSNPESVYKAYNLIKNIGSYTSVSNNYITDIFVYIKNYDLILTDHSIYRTKQFYDAYCQFAQLSYEDFCSELNGRYFNTVLPLRTLKQIPNQKELSVLTYVQSYPFNNDLQGNIFILIDHNKFVSSFSGNYANESACFRLVNTNGSVLLSLGNEALVRPEYYSLSNEIGEDQSGKINVMYFVQDSEIINLKYISVENIKNITALLNPIRIAVFIYVVLLLLVGGIGIFIIAYRSSKPIIDLSQLLHKSVKTNHTNDIKSITGAVEQLIREKTHSEHIITEQLPILRKNLIYDIIHGNFHAAEEITSACKIAGCSFNYDYYCVISVEIDAPTEAAKNDCPIIKYAFSNIAAELFSNLGGVYIDDTEWFSVSVLLNLKQNTQSQRRDIAKHFDLICKVLLEEFKTHTNIGVGSIQQGVLNVFSSYIESKKAIEFCKIMEGNGITFYDEINNIGGRYTYPTEKENNIIRSVMQGELEQTKQELNSIIDECSSYSLETNRCLFYGLMGTGLKILMDESLNHVVFFAPDEDPYNRLIACKNILELKNVLYDIFETICDYIQKRSSYKKEKMKASILEYIQQNFQNPNMSLEMVADQFAFHYTYLSHFFKDYLGTNFSNYLTELRVEQAERYLKETDWSIAVIAEKVGYANSGVLIKNFKKSKGMTPGKLREKMSDNSLD